MVIYFFHIIYITYKYYFIQMSIISAYFINRIYVRFVFEVIFEM
jgi:hypothetical protein